MSRKPAEHTFRARCSNWNEIASELNLSTKDLKTGFRHYKTQLERLRLSYPVTIHSSITNKFTLVKNLVYPETYTPIDDGMVDIIIYLNRNGYYTQFCCEGHMCEKIHIGYLVLDEPEEDAIELASALRTLIQEGIPIRRENGIMGPRIHIEWDFETEEEKQNKLGILRKHLLNLPPLNHAQDSN